MKKILIIILILIFAGCSPVYFQPANPKDDYRYMIEEWQKRVRKEGWNESLVDDILHWSLVLSKYVPEPKGRDHWKTYPEFLKDFKGDCEDITVFMYGTLKRLGYPYGLRFRAIRMPLGDHAVLMVQFPGGKWKRINSVPAPGDFIDLAVSRIIVEWDENNIYYPDKG